MASVTLVKPYVTSTLQRPPFPFEPTSVRPRDDSFASYFTLIRENFTGNSTMNPNSALPALGRKRADGELDIFGAEKYFSGTMDVLDSVDPIPVAVGRTKSLSKKEPKLSRKSKSRSSATVSSCSEASANSQSTLLRDRRRPLRPPATAGQRQEKGRSFLGGVFRCTCSGKDDADTEGAEFDAQSANSQKGAAFGGFRPDGEMGNRRIDGLGTARSNLGPSRRRGLTVLAPMGGDEEDARSDASSDLFEIESLSINSHPFFEAASACYEPSEASIEWSVATASAANFSAAAEEWGAEQIKKGKNSRKGKAPGGLLLGCVSEKAVRVTAEKGNGRVETEGSTVTAMAAPAVGRYRVVAGSAARAPLYVR